VPRVIISLYNLDVVALGELIIEDKGKITG
jgi:hypothetical protein